MATDVPGIISSQQTYVSSWAAHADSFIAQVAALANADSDVVVPDSLAFGVVDTTIGSTLASLKPEAPTVDSTIDSAPSPPQFSFSTIETAQVPDSLGAAPQLNLPAQPSLDVTTAPSIPSVGSVSVPSAPTLSLPAEPTVTAVNLPAPPSIELPEFTSSAPVDDLVAPSNVFSFAEQQYESALLDPLKAKLLSDLENGGYGIEPADEQALFDRARAREVAAALGEQDTILSDFAGRGFPLEPGEAQVALAREMQRAHDKLSDTNRTITLERSRLYVENRQFTIKEVRELESVLLSYHTALMERALNAAKATLDAAIAIYNTLVARYNARVAAYQAEAQVFESRIRAALAIVEQYKVQVEAANLELDAQKLGLEIYRARLGALQNVVDLYRVSMEAANVQANVERTKIEAFRGQVEAYAEGVRAKSLQVQAYEAAVRGEVARMDGYRAEADAYRARVDGVRATADIRMAQANAESERAKAQVSLFQAQADAYRTRIDAQLKTVQVQQESYRLDVSAFTVAAEALRAAAEVEIKSRDANIRWNVAVADNKVKVAVARIEAFKAGAEVRLGASKFGADFYKSIVATTLGSINTLAATISSS